MISLSRNILATPQNYFQELFVGRILNTFMDIRLIVLQLSIIPVIANSSDRRGGLCLRTSTWTQIYSLTPTPGRYHHVSTTHSFTYRGWTLAQHDRPVSFQRDIHSIANEGVANVTPGGCYELMKLNWTAGTSYVSNNVPEEWSSPSIIYAHRCLANNPLIQLSRFLVSSNV